MLYFPRRDGKLEKFGRRRKDCRQAFDIVDTKIQILRKEARKGGMNEMKQMGKSA